MLHSILRSNTPRSRGKQGNASIVMLVATVAGAILFTIVAGFFVYGNTRGLVVAKDWVEHTQEVLTTLQTAAQQADRIEFSTRLYMLNQDENHARTAQINAIGLETSALRLRQLVSDSPAQMQEADRLAVSSRAVRLSLVHPEQLGQGVLNQKLLEEGLLDEKLAEQLMSCREAISLAAERERGLLKQRSQRFQHESTVSLTTECAFVGLSLSTLVVLFGFLLRDAVSRRRAALRSVLTNAELAGSVKALEERISESRLLTTCRDELQLCVSVDQVYRAAAACLARLLPHSSGSLCILNHSRNMLEGVSHWGSAATALTETFMPEDCCGLRLGQMRWREAGLSEIDCTHFSSDSPTRYVCIPLVAQSETLGVLWIECVREQAYLMLHKHMDGMRQLLQLTGMAVASLNLRSKLENQSIRDPLTGLFNRHFLQIGLTRELSRAARQSSSVAVLMLDVDHFKRFNDTYGHAAGDTMLRCIGEAFCTNVRTEDIVCRYGGEEFCIILPGITPDTSAVLAERIRLAIAGLRLPVESALGAYASVSIGVALYPIDAADGELLLRKADQALYRAKHSGRNQVCFNTASSTEITVSPAPETLLPNLIPPPPSPLLPQLALR